MEKPNGKEEIFKYQESLNEIAQKHNLDERTKLVVGKLFSFVEKGNKEKAESLLRKQFEMSNWFKDESLIPIILEDVQDYIDLRKMEDSVSKEEPVPNEPNVQNSENTVSLPEKEPSKVLDTINPEEDTTIDINESIDNLAKEIAELRAQGLDDEVRKKEEEFQNLLKERDIIEAGNPKPKKPQIQKPPKVEPPTKPTVKKEEKKKSEPKKTLSSFAELAVLKEPSINMPNEKPPQNNKNNSENRNQNRGNPSRPFEQRKEVEFHPDGSPKRISGYTGDEVADIVEKTSSRKNKKENVDTTNTESNSQKENTNTNTVNNSVVISLASKIVDGDKLSASEKQQLKKHEAEVLALAKSKKEEAEKQNNIRESIIAAEVAGKELTLEQKVFANRPSERSIIDAEKTKRETEAAAKQAQEQAEAAAAKIKADNEAAEAKVKAERDAFGKMDRTGKRAKAMERYQQMVDKKTKGMNEAELRDFQFASQEKRDRANDRRENGYSQFAKEYQSVIENKEYQDLKSRRAELGINEKEILAQYESRISNAKSKAESVGSLGSKYLSLEDARQELAKASQDYKTSFVRKYPGSRLVAGIGNMFGFKNSGIKEGEKTKEMQKAMSEAQAKYDNIRQSIMQGTLSEEYGLAKVIKLDNGDLEHRMRDMVTNVDKNLIVSERNKLEDLKHVLAETVKKPAFLQFANFYKEKYWGNIKNPRVRRVVQRVTNALLLSGAIWATGGLAGVAVGAAAAKALVSGAVGESAAAGVAGIFGGRKNERGEFEKFAKKRDVESQESAAVFIRAISEQIRSGKKPDVSREIFSDRRLGEERAAVNMQMREMRLRKGEMWTRLLAGGAAGAYLMHEVIPAPTPNPDPDPIPVPPSPDNGFALEGDFVEASSKGSIQTFMNLKKEMIAHYKGLDTGIKYGEANEFANLTDDEVVEKLLATGKFDDLTGDIMRAKTLPEFMAAAREHGFWDPKGWGNRAVDSASIPAGSIVGMEVAPDGNMQFYMELPDGKHIALNDNFSEALDQHIKGVNFIDTNRPRVSSINTVPAASVEPAPDTSLDAGDINNVTTPANAAPTIVGVAPSIENVADAASPDAAAAFFKANPNFNPDSTKDILEQLAKQQGKSLEGTPITGIDMVHDRALDKNLSSVSYDHKEYFLEQHLGNRQVKMIDPVSYRIYGDGVYVLERHAMIDVPGRGPVPIGVLRDEYHNYISDQNLKIQALRQQALDQYETTEAGVTTPAAPIDEAFENDVKNAAINTKDSWVDERFGKDNLLGKHTPGTETNAWENLKNDRVFDHIRSNDNSDDVYGAPNSSDKVEFTGTPKEKKFLNDLYQTSLKYNMAPGTNETVDQFAKRVAETEVRANAKRI